MAPSSPAPARKAKQPANKKSAPAKKVREARNDRSRQPAPGSNRQSEQSSKPALQLCTAPESRAGAIGGERSVVFVRCQSRALHDGASAARLPAKFDQSTPPSSSAMTLQPVVKSAKKTAKAARKQTAKQAAKQVEAVQEAVAQAAAEPAPVAAVQVCNGRCA